MSNDISSEDQLPAFPPLPPPPPPPPLDAPFDDCSTIRRFSSSCREFSLDTAAKNTDFFASLSCGKMNHLRMSRHPILPDNFNIVVACHQEVKPVLSPARRSTRRVARSRVSRTACPRQPCLEPSFNGQTLIQFMTKSVMHGQSLDAPSRPRSLRRIGRLCRWS